ncbi:MAG: hypothetical protein H2171_17485 [Opitutus sp.]|nr:hypothetical protein [Opitutus sp.]
MFLLEKTKNLFEEARARCANAQPTGGVAVVRKVNQITRGWATAFHYGNSTHVFSNQQAFVRNRLRRWLWRKYSRTHGLFEFFTDDRLHGQYKLWHWPLTAAWKQ